MSANPRASAGAVPRLIMMSSSLLPVARAACGLRAASSLAWRQLPHRREELQVRRRLILPGRHQQAFIVDQIGFLAEHDPIVGHVAVALGPFRLRIEVAPE